MLSGTSVSSRNSAIKTQQQQQQKSVWSDILSSVENAAVGPCYRQLIVLGTLYSLRVQTILLNKTKGSLDDMLSTNSELSHDRKTKPPLRYSFESLFLDEAASKDATGGC